MNWNEFAPNSWKRGTFKILTERAYLTFTTDELGNRELKYIEKVFYENIASQSMLLNKFYSKYQNSSTIKSHQSLTVFYTNADNLINKRNELYHSITSLKPEIICITEILPNLLMTASFKFKALIVYKQQQINVSQRCLNIYKEMLKSSCSKFW